MSFLTGSPDKFKQMSTLSKQQQPLQNQLIRSAQGRGGGGAFGTAADYYRDLLNEDNATFNALAAPEQRRFREQIVPDLAEQFAGMGSGGLSSSGFQNAAINAGTDLSERLGAIRAQLRQQGAQGLTSIGQQALAPTVENVQLRGTPGALETLAPLAGQALGAFGGPAGSAIGGFLGNQFGNWLGKRRNSSPYGANQRNSQEQRF